MCPCLAWQNPITGQVWSAVAEHGRRQLDLAAVGHIYILRMTVMMVRKLAVGRMTVLEVGEEEDDDGR